MKDIHAWAGLCVLGLAAVGLADNHKKAKPANLVSNPSFEQKVGDNGLPDGWGFHPSEGAKYKHSIVEAAHEGKRSLMIEGEGKFAVVMADRVEIKPDQIYAARGWVKIEGQAGDQGAQATIKFDYLDAEGQYLGSTNAANVEPGSKDWQELSVVSHAQHMKGAKFIAAALVISNKGKAFFDDLEMATIKGDADNLALNGTFETIAGSKPVGWIVVTSEGGKAQIAASRKQKKNGWYSLAFKGNSEWAVAVAQRVAYDKNKSYTLTGQVKIAAGEATIKIDYFNGDEYLGSDYSNQPFGSDWEELSVESSGDYDTATHISAVAVGQGEFEAFFDDMVLKAK